MGDIQAGFYKHYKGNTYRVLFVAKHSETLEDMVVYEAAYDSPVARYFVRPAALFTGTVKVDGKTKQRFSYIGESLTSNT